MSTPAAEQAFCQALANADSVRQSAIAVAQAKYGFVKANYAQFVSDLVSANTVYFTSVVTAANAGVIDPQLAVPAPIACGWSAKIGGNF
jgi:hypothetical protein